MDNAAILAELRKLTEAVTQLGSRVKMIEDAVFGVSPEPGTLATVPEAGEGTAASAAAAAAGNASAAPGGARLKVDLPKQESIGTALYRELSNALLSPRQHLMASSSTSSSSSSPASAGASPPLITLDRRVRELEDRMVASQKHLAHALAMQGRQPAATSGGGVEFLHRALKDVATMLRIYQINDVYSLQHLARFRSFVESDKSRVRSVLYERGRPETDVQFITILPGDFLSPYLLSSFDKVRITPRSLLSSLSLSYTYYGCMRLTPLASCSFLSCCSFAHVCAKTPAYL